MPKAGKRLLRAVKELTEYTRHPDRFETITRPVEVNGSVIAFHTIIKRKKKVRLKLVGGTDLAP